MVINDYGNEERISVQLDKLFNYRIQIGDCRRPGLMTPDEKKGEDMQNSVSYTHLRAHET